MPLIPTIRPKSSGALSPGEANAAARAALVKMSARKSRMIRVIEAALRPLVHIADCVRGNSEKHDSEADKILVMEYWNLGDVVMLTPFLRSLRIQYPHASVTVVTSPKAAPLFENQGLVDRILTVRIPWAQHYSRWRKYNPLSLHWVELLRMVKTLRDQHFDLAFTARSDMRENFILWVAGVTRRVGYGFGGGGFLLTDLAIPDLHHPHMASRWLRLLEHVGGAALEHLPRLQVTAAEEQSALEILDRHGVSGGELLIGVHPGARSKARQWGEENFSALIAGLEAQFPLQTVWFQEYSPKNPQAEQCERRFLTLPLRQFMAVLSRCRLLICNDSGPMHIATALGVPVVAVFGPTEPAWFGPLGEGNRVVSQPGFWCRPCFDYCIFDQPYCLRMIPVEDVLQACVQAIARVTTRNEVKVGS